MQTQEPTQATSISEPQTPSGRQTWRVLAQPWWQATKAILPIYLATRLVFLLLSYFAGVLFFIPNYSTSHFTLSDIIYKWYQWDAKRFITIATQGYLTKEYAAFFPLYPTLERDVSRLLHLDVLVTGMLISNLALLGALIVLYRLAESEFGKDTARRTILYLSIFPTAFFFFAAYNESLFLLFMLLCFYALRRSSWWVAGLFGFLAILTRSIGAFLGFVFLYEYVCQNYAPLRQSWQDKAYQPLLRRLLNLVPIVGIPLGLVVYAFGLYKRFGDPLAFIHAQSNWRGGHLPFSGPLAGIKELLHISPFTFAAPHVIIDLTALGLFVILTVLCFVGPFKLERHQWSFALFAILALIFSLLLPGGSVPGVPYDPIPSMQRFVLEIFIGFVIMARIGGKYRWLHQGYILVALPMLTFLTIQFMTGHWTV